MKADRSNFYVFNKALKGFAKSNRNKGTKAEACLWKYCLRRKQMKGYTFKRQRPVLNYIADFMCQELKLIIEVDGVTHHSDRAQQKDKIRQLNIEQAGFTVLRFRDEEVLQNMDNVKRVLVNAVSRIEESHSTEPD